LKVQLQCREFKSTQKLLNIQIKQKERAIEKAEALINTLIAGDDEKQQQKEQLLSVPGLAEKSVNLLIAQLPPIEDFKNARQLAAWMGVTPKHYESGTSVKRYTPISKMGSTHLRCALFMPSLSAMQHNPVIKTFAERLLGNGKARKAVVIACMRKLVHQIYAILKHGVPFDPNHIHHVQNQNPEKHASKTEKPQLQTT